MVFESALANTLLITLVTGGVISGLAALASTDAKFKVKKFIYALGLSTIAGLGIVTTQFNGVVTEANAILVFLAIAGGAGLGNGLVKVGNKLRS